MKPITQNNFSKKLKNLFFRIFNGIILHPLELVFSSKANQQFPYPPVFILGAPRCGSTLLVQVLTDAFDIGYLSNRHAQFYGFPALAERIYKPIKHKKNSNFTSTHGITENLDEPAECGDFWYRFFRKEPSYVLTKDMPKRKGLQFRRSILSLIHACKKPVIFKNLYAANRIQPIAKILPEALYIVITRDETAIAHSILTARENVFGSYDHWFSLPPRNIDTLLKMKPAEQVVEQIRSIYQQIEDDIDTANIPSNRILLINYEDFCNDTHQYLSKFSDLLLSHGITLNRKFNIPKSFTVPSHNSIPETLEIDVSRYVNTHK